MSDELLPADQLEPDLETDMASSPAKVLRQRRELRRSRRRVLPDPIRLDDLPPPKLSRWRAHAKALVVAGIAAGIITDDDACARYGLTLEELHSWQRIATSCGPGALAQRRLREVRRVEAIARSAGTPPEAAGA